VNGGFITYSLGNLNSLIAGTYGTSWASTSSLSYGVVGTTVDSDFNYTDWITSKWTNTTGTLGLPNSVSFGTVSDSSVAASGSKVQMVYGSPFPFSPGGGIMSPCVVPVTSLSGWKRNDPFNFTIVKIDNPVSNHATDLYVIASDGNSGTAEFEGTFNLTADGNLTYTAIPEPSTYAIILGALTIGSVALRRRCSKAAV
jgi:hypothetical protein